MRNYNDNLNGNPNGDFTPTDNYLDSPEMLVSEKSLATTHTIRPTLEKEYKVYLKQYTEEFTEDEHYLNVGSPRISQGWKIHLSVISPSIKLFLEDVVPILLYHKAPFKLIKSHELHESVNAGEHGHSKVGKIITVLLDNDAIIEDLVLRLKKVTDRFEGPQVITDFFISKNIYARYGSFTSLVEIDPYGNHKRLIKDRLGNYLQDQYNLPPSVPTGIENPFVGIADKAPEFPDRRIIANKYILLNALKLDLKGNVHRALYFNKYLIPTFCVVKEGRKGVFPDAHNRDVRRRLWWQREAFKKVGTNIATPRVIDLIEEQDVSYLVTQYVPKANNLNVSLIQEMKRVPWGFQTEESKKKLLNLLENMVKIVAKLHKLNLVHRDFTDNNLMITNNRKLWSIDLELLYSLIDHQPDPPFGTGTPGYMSPEQEKGAAPEFADDYYSIGSMIVLFVSGGIEPAHLIDQNIPLLKKRLLFLSESESLSDLACRCLHPTPSKRSDTVDALNQLLVNDRLALNAKKEVTITSPSDKEIEQVIIGSIETIASDFMTHNNLWHVPIRQDESWDVYPLGNRHIYSNIHQGVSGVIYGLSILKSAGFNIESTNTNVNKSFEFITQDIQRRMTTMAPSLYYGKAGLALLFAQLTSSSMMETHPFYVELVEKLLEQPSKEYDVIYGIAGQGLALLRCTNVLDKGITNSLLQNYAWILKSNQLSTGAWNKTSDTAEKEIATGFGYGVAGIVYFLLKYYQHAKDEEALQCALRGLRYLDKNKEKKKDSIHWRIDGNSKSHGAFWCAGSPGIALAFLKAAEVTNDIRYQFIAEQALRIHPKHFAFSKLGQCHGMTGLGELYLEAFNLTHNDEWKERAQWVAELLFHFRKEKSDGKVYWLSDKYNIPSANFMTGDAGIIHFLTRFINQGKLPFPIIG